MSLVNKKSGGVAVVNDATIIQGKAECGQLELLVDRRYVLLSIVGRKKGYYTALP
jgi:hypothetical protein